MVTVCYNPVYFWKSVLLFHINIAPIKLFHEVRLELEAVMHEHIIKDHAYTYTLINQ